MVFRAFPRRRTTACVALTGSLLALALGGCAATTAHGQDDYTIGLISSQTGPGSQLGVGELRGAQLAVEHLNAEGGVNGHKVRLISADDQSNPSQTVLQARKMLGHVDGLIGSSTSGPCKAIAPQAIRGQIVDYCLSPGIKPAGYQWSSSAATIDLARELVDHWHGQGITRIALLSTTDASGIDGADSVKEAIKETPGMELATAATFTPDAVSVVSQVQQISASKPQAVVVWSTGAGAGVAFQGMAQAGLDLPVATTDGNLTYAFLKRIKAFLPDPLLIPATRDFWVDSAWTDPTVRELEDKYHADYLTKYGEQPDFGPGVAYDAVLVMAHAIDKAGGDHTKVKGALESTQGFPGVVGTYSFSAKDHRGLTQKDVGIVQATKDGFSYLGGGGE
ncbi:ABC transporter substrate-binding protein [Raineyella sp. LH-20]|uniref:ABC transporter substrate-binding protein n=1 Tax=Raineyella sp. LH-20 TaxID=3081204 RepID=UPI00295521A0|nr:ABC transporter substrate-binding protein [Raineyella sp. LH-20]WOP17426.1 ABC transporter substrate-binding protein [Raineyella sp. LH-20]